MAYVLLFEPEPLAAGRIAAALRGAVAQVVAVPDPAISPRGWLDQRFDAVVANAFRSRADPSMAIAQLRALAGHRPLMVLTSEDDARQRIQAMQHGADDAMASDGDGRELAARMQALLRRRSLVDAMLAVDELQIDLIGRQVSRAGRDIIMPLREFDLLARLARSTDTVVSRIDLLRAVWRLDFDPGTNRIEVHMSRLRQRIDAGHSHAMLRTVKGTGYALVSRLGARATGAFVAD